MTTWIHSAIERLRRISDSVASIDDLCNALDINATGQNSNMVIFADPAHTADSLSNHNAYIGNGNTLNVFTP